MQVDRTKFFEYLNHVLDDINSVPRNHTAVPVEKVILTIVDKLKSCKFDGIISIKIKETEIYQPRIEETAVLNRDYIFLESEKST